MILKNNMFFDKTTHENWCYRLIKKHNRKYKDHKFNIRIVYNVYTFILSLILLLNLLFILLYVYFKIIVPILVWHHNQVEYKIYTENYIEYKQKQDKYNKEKEIQEKENQLNNKIKELEEIIKGIK